jgi:serine/threonine protein kinase
VLHAWGLPERPPAARANVIAQATAALERLAPAIDEAHEHGILHRDLKPSNILFDQHGKPYLADFGIAKLIKSEETNLTTATRPYTLVHQKRWWPNGRHGGRTIGALTRPAVTIFMAI